MTDTEMILKCCEAHNLDVRYSFGTNYEKTFEVYDQPGWEPARFISRSHNERGATTLGMFLDDYCQYNFERGREAVK